MGTRDIDAALETASEQPQISSVILAKLEFDSGNINIHTSIGDIVFDGETYLGVGAFGSISPAQEDSELSASYIDITLSGIDPALISIIFNEYYQGRDATIYIGLFNLTTRVLIEPTIIYKGLMDNTFLDVSGSTGAIKLRVNNRLAAWDKANNRRYNDADQQEEYPGDLAFQFVDQIAQTETIWGRSDEE